MANDEDDDDLLPPRSAPGDIPLPPPGFVVPNTNYEIMAQYDPSTGGFYRGWDAGQWVKHIEGVWPGKIEKIKLVRRHSPEHGGVQFWVEIRTLRGDLEKALIRVIMSTKTPRLFDAKIGSLCIELLRRPQTTLVTAPGWATDPNAPEDYQFYANLEDGYDYLWAPKEIARLCRDKEWRIMLASEALKYSNRLHGPTDHWPIPKDKPVTQYLWVQPRFLLNFMDGVRYCNTKDPTQIHPSLGVI